MRLATALTLAVVFACIWQHRAASAGRAGAILGQAGAVLGRAVRLGGKSWW